MELLKTLILLSVLYYVSAIYINNPLSESNDETAIEILEIVLTGKSELIATATSLSPRDIIMKQPRSSMASKITTSSTIIRTKRSRKNRKNHGKCRKNSRTKSQRQMRKKKQKHPKCHYEEDAFACALENFLIKVPELNVTKPWIVHATVTYGSNHSIDMSINVTTNPIKTDRIIVTYVSPNESYPITSATETVKLKKLKNPRVMVIVI